MLLIGTQINLDSMKQIPFSSAAMLKGYESLYTCQHWQPGGQFPIVSWQVQQKDGLPLGFVHIPPSLLNSPYLKYIQNIQKIQSYKFLINMYICCMFRPPDLVDLVSKIGNRPPTSTYHILCGNYFTGLKRCSGTPVCCASLAYLVGQHQQRKDEVTRFRMVWFQCKVLFGSVWCHAMSPFDSRPKG